MLSHFCKHLRRPRAPRPFPARRPRLPLRLEMLEDRTLPAPAVFASTDLPQAIVANGTLRARNPAIWGEGTTACASDSKKFGVWDQNLLTELHIRYRGPGVMIYWHVEKGAVYIYSQLKRCSSSEVAAMMERVLCVTGDVER